MVTSQYYVLVNIRYRAKGGVNMTIVHALMRYGLFFLFMGLIASGAYAGASAPLQGTDVLVDAKVVEDLTHEHSVPVIVFYK